MSANNLSLRGIAISGAEAGSEVSYGNLGMPSYKVDMSYYAQHGMNTVRIPINWDYIVKNAGDKTASASGLQYLENIKTSVTDMLSHGLNVMLDLHSYMRFSPGSYAGSGNHIATAQDTYNVWSLIANKLSGVAKQYSDKLSFEIANEPNSMSTQQVVLNNNAGIAAIRDAGLHNMVVLQGNSWSGLHSWYEVGSATDGKSNAQLLTPSHIVDPLNNYAISVHQYVDWNGSGTSPVGQSLDSFKNYLNFTKFMDWVHTNNVKVILGEFGGGKDANAIADVNYLLQQVEANPYVVGKGGFLGWTAWVGGHTWAQSNFNYLGPTADGKDNVLMTQVYIKHLDGSFVPIPEPSPPPPVHTDPVPHPVPDPVVKNGVTHDILWGWGAREVISAFNPLRDVINLSSFHKNYNDFSLRGDGKGNLIIDLLQVDNHLITLKGVSLSQFSAANLKGVTGGNYQSALDGDAKFYSFKWDYGVKTVIKDFNTHIGVIDLQTFSGKQFSDLKIKADAHGDASINLGFNSQLITLVGIKPGELTAHNFVGLNGHLADAMVASTVPPVHQPTKPIPIPPHPTDPAHSPDSTTTPPPSSAAQTFTFGWNWGGRDVVNNFHSTVDKVDLTKFWINYKDISIHNDGGGNVVIDLLSLNNQTITLAHTSLATLSVKNFKGITGDYKSAVDTNPVKYYDYGWHYGANTTIDHFDSHVGVINLTAFHQDFSNVHIHNNPGGNAVVDLSFDHQTITLLGVSAHDVTAHNFLM